jgi:predicted O-linked N-acetylglucosamine transferase (SPINDLY family)
MADLKADFAAALAAQRAGRLADAERLYLALLDAEPGAVSALANLAGVRLAANDLVGAERYARQLALLAADLPNAHANLAAILHAQARYAEAAEVARAAIARGVLSADLHYALGLGLDRAGRWNEARTAYGAALALEPDHGPALSEALYLAKQCCDWDEAERLGAAFHAAAARGVAGLTPFVFLAEASTPAEQRRVAAAWCAGIGPVAARPPLALRDDGRFVIGYASADLHDHPTAHLLAGVLEAHDRSRFEVHLYSWGPDDGSAVRARLRATAAGFHELRGATTAAIAQRIRDDGVQVLVDLKGHTADARTELFLGRAAPLQVNWLGCPGTLGSKAWDWLIADAAVLPPGAEGDYAERVWRLDCYQPNDPERPRPRAARPRRELGLPDDAMVYCCFNNSWKLTRERFADWLEVLRARPDAVLWLLEPKAGQGIADRLRAAAAAEGIDPARLVFAPQVGQRDYLARYLAADLFLDTAPYGAHTTASDALWMGCPVLTAPGTTFASRVAASLLEALELPELVAADRAAYVAAAVAMTRAESTALRATLDEHRASTALFDARAMAAALETAYASFVADARGRAQG